MVYDPELACAHALSTRAPAPVRLSVSRGHRLLHRPRHRCREGHGQEGLRLRPGARVRPRAGRHRPTTLPMHRPWGFQTDAKVQRFNQASSAKGPTSPSTPSPPPAAPAPLSLTGGGMSTTITDSGTPSVPQRLPSQTTSGRATASLRRSALTSSDTHRQCQALLHYL